MAKDKREAILKAAEKIIKTKRFHEVKVEDIATEAGVGKGTIYRYFKDKEELYLEVAFDGFIYITEKLNTLSRKELSFTAKLLEMSTCFEKFATGRRPVMRVMDEILNFDKRLAKCYRTRLRELKRENRGAFRTLFQQGLDNDILLLDITAAQYAEYWIHQLIGLSHFPSDVERVPLEKLIKLHLGYNYDSNE